MSIHLDPRGELIVSTQESVVLLHALATGERLRDVVQVSAMTRRGWSHACAAFDPIGDRLITSASNAVKVWDRALSSPIRTITARFEGARSAISALMVLSGDVAITGHLDGVLRRWDLRKGSCARSPLRGHRKEVTHLALRHDGKIVSASVDRTVRVWDLASGDSSLWLENLPAYPLALDLDRDLVAVSSSGLSLAALRLSDGRRFDLPGHADAARAAIFLDDGRVVSSGNDIRVHELQTGAITAVFETGGNVAPMAMVGGRLITLGTGYRVFELAQTPAIEIRARHAGHVYDACAIADGYATAAGDCTIKIWRPDGRFVTSLREHEHNVSTLRALSGQRLLSAGFDRKVLLWDLTGERVLRAFEGCKEWIVALSVSADGRRVATVERLGAVRVWEVESGKLVARFGIEAEWPQIELSPDGSSLFVGHKHGAIDVADVTQKKIVRRLEGEPSALTALAVLPSENVLVAVGAGVRTWSLPDLAPAKSFADHAERVVGLSVGDDFLATADTTGFVLYWDVTKGPVGGRRTEPRGSPTAFAARLDGSVAYGFASGEVQVVPTTTPRTTPPDPA